MYFDKVKLSVKSSNYESIAKFSSTLDDAHLLVVANNCNDYSFNDYANAGIFGAHTNRLVDRYEAFVGTKENHVLNKIAVFNREQIDLNTNTIVSGNIIPSSNIVYDLGSDTQRWKDLYLSGQTISLGNTIIKSDSTTNSFSISDDTNSPLTMIAGEYKILAEDKTELSLQIKDNSLFVNTTNPAGDVISELNISEMNTNTMIEGSNNLFYTHDRVANIIDGSNVFTCNYIKNTSNEISNRITVTSNAIEGRLTVTSNAIEGRLTVTSNAIEGRLTVTSNAIEGRLTETSNKIEGRLTVTSNAIEGRLTVTSNAIEGRLTETSNAIEGRLTETSNAISTRITLLSTDQITEHQNALNRFIVNNEYDGDIRITGELRTYDLTVYGTTTTIQTDNYTAEVLNIESLDDYTQGALTVSKKGNANKGTNIFESLYNDRIVAKIDTGGVLYASNFSGDGSMITNVRLADNLTDELAEGNNNLYFTHGRVATIIDGSNVFTCNYIKNTSNEISNRITETSNAIEGRLTVTSNAIEGRLTETSNEIENRLTFTSNVISERVTDLDNTVTTYLQNLNLDQVYQGTSNKYIYNNVWDNNLYVTGRLMVTDIEIADLEEILAQEGTGNIGNFYTYIDTIAKKSVETAIDDKMNNTGDITTSNINVIGNIIPTSNEQFDLGSIDKRWRDLYLSGNTINMGGSKISLDDETGGFSFKNKNNELSEVITSSVKIVDKVTNKTIKMKSKDNKISFVEETVDGVEEEVAAMNDSWTSNSDNIQYGNIKIFNDKIERVTDTGAIIPYTDQEILFDNSSIINFTGSDVISDEQTSGVYDTTLVPRKRSTRDNSKFYKIFDVTIVSESQNLIFSSVLYRNYVKLSTGEMVPTDLSYHVIFSYYSLSQITLKDKDGNDCISFNGNEIWFDYVANSEYLHVSLVPNYTISIVSR